MFKKSQCFLRIAGTCGLFLAASCSNVIEPPAASHRDNGPRIVELELEHTVYFDTDSAALDPSEREALHRFAHQLDKRLILERLVIGHADIRADDSYNDALSARRAASVAAVLHEAGVERERVSQHALGRRLPVDADERETSLRLSRRVELLARGGLVIEPNCPDWSRASAARAANLPSSNFGCATTVNFLRMLDDPRDFVEGGNLGSADGSREAAAIRRYRADEVKPLKVESSDQ